MGCVFGQRHSQQIRYLFPEIVITKAIDEVMKHRERQQQRHHSRLAQLQSRRLFAVFGHGRLHHSLDAVAAQPAVVADTFDFQQGRLICRPIFCKYGRLAKPLITPKSFGFGKGPSVRQPRPSLKYCFRSKFL